MTYFRSPIVHESAFYGQGKDPVLLDDLACTGQEKVLWDCKNPGWYKQNCGHGEDVGVDCSPCKYYNFQGIHIKSYRIMYICRSLKFI